MTKKLFALYVIFALIVIAVNLLVQRLMLIYFSGNSGFFIALFFGTFIGVLLSYFLDKRWIFRDTQHNLKTLGKQFFLYASIGLIHNPIFWFIESLFWFTWKTEGMREIGAIIGLSIAYLVKYFLLKNYVFKPTSPNQLFSR